MNLGESGKRSRQPGPGPSLVAAGHRHRPPDMAPIRCATSAVWKTIRATPGQAAAGISGPSAPATPPRRPGRCQPRRPEKGAGQPGPGRRWYQAGHPHRPPRPRRPRAMFNLGVLERIRATRARPPLVQAGHPHRPPRPGTQGDRQPRHLEKELGNLAQGPRWYQQAIDTGHPDQAPKAMYNLGGLENEQGNPLQGRHWWQQAASTGHPDQAPKAMINLGVLEYQATEFRPSPPLVAAGRQYRSPRGGT